MKHFTSLVTNVKGLTTDITLTALNAITGENRAGKTAISQAVHLAVNASIPEASRPSDLLELAPGRNSPLVSKLSGDGVSLSFQLPVSGGKAKEPVRQVVGVDVADLSRALPLVSVKDLLDLGAVKSREAIFRRFGFGSIEEPIGLDPEASALWNSAVISITAADAATALAELSAHFRGNKLRLGREAGTITKQVDALRSRLELSPGGVELLPSLEAQWRKALASGSRDGWTNELDGVADSIALIDKQIASTPAPVDVTPLRSLVAVAEKRYQRVTAATQVMAAAVEASSNACPLCESALDSSARLISLEQLQITRANELSAARAALDIASRASPLAMLQTQRVSLTARADQLSRTLSSTEPYDGPPAPELEARIKRLRESEEGRKMLSTLEMQARAKRREGDLFKDLERRASDMLTKKLLTVKGAAEASVNRYMIDGFTAILDLEDGECRWCVASKDGGVASKISMCGAERVSLIVALALAWTEDAPLRLLVLDDSELGPLHSSPANLQLLMRRLESCVDSGLLTQVFLIGVRAGEVSERWNVISR